MRESLGVFVPYLLDFIRCEHKISHRLDLNCVCSDITFVVCKKKYWSSSLAMTESNKCLDLWLFLSWCILIHFTMSLLHLFVALQLNLCVFLYITSRNMSCKNKNKKKQCALKVLTNKYNLHLTDCRWIWIKWFRRNTFFFFFRSLNWKALKS